MSYKKRGIPTAPCAIALADDRPSPPTRHGFTGTRGRGGDDRGAAETQGRSHSPSVRTINCLADAFEAPAAALVLDPNASVRDRVALAVLSCSEETLKHVAKLLDVE